MNVFLHLHNTRLRFLLCGMCFLTFFFPLSVGAQEEAGLSAPRYRVAFWNVENLFDTENDTLANDDDFTPRGANRWSRRRYSAKLTHLCQTLVALAERPDGLGLDPPLLVGLAEVENDRVLRDLCLGTPLRKLGYTFVHFDSPDRRGIDNALLYNPKRFLPFLSQPISVSDSSRGFYTRDILLVEGVTELGDTLIVLVNHFPSKRNGAAGERQRMHIARVLRSVMDTLAASHPSAAIVAMGDFNATPDEAAVQQGLMCGADSSGAAFVNLMAPLPPGTGSHKFQGQWSWIDQIVVSRNMTWLAPLLAEARPRQKSPTVCPLQVLDLRGKAFAPDFLLLDDEKYMDKKLFRTYLGVRYQGGYSDHLPVYVDLTRLP